MKQTEKALGVLANMETAGDFLQLLSIHIESSGQKTQSRIITISNPYIVDENSKQENSVEILTNELTALANQGVNAVALPCNITYQILTEISKNTPISLISMADATITMAKRTHPKGSWLLTCSDTKRNKLYQTTAQKNQYMLLYPPEDIQSILNKSAQLIKQQDIPGAAELITQAVSALVKIQNFSIMTACPDLGYAYTAANLPSNTHIACLQALSAACVEFLASS